MAFNKTTTDSFNTATMKMDELLTAFDSMSAPEKTAYLLDLNNNSPSQKSNSALFDTITELDAFVVADKLEFLSKLNNASVPEQSKQTILCTKKCPTTPPKIPFKG